MAGGGGRFTRLLPALGRGPWKRAGDPVQTTPPAGATGRQDLGRSRLSLRQFWARHLLLFLQPSASARGRASSLRLLTPNEDLPGRQRVTEGSAEGLHGVPDVCRGPGPGQSWRSRQRSRGREPPVPRERAYFWPLALSLGLPISRLSSQQRSSRASSRC